MYVCAHTVEEGRVLYLISQLWVLTNHCTVPRSAFLSFLLFTLQPAHPLHRKQPHRIRHVMVPLPPENEREDGCDNTSLLWTVVLQVLTIGQALAWFLMLQSSSVLFGVCGFAWSQNHDLLSGSTELSAEQQEKLPGMTNENWANWLLGSVWCLVHCNINHAV